MRDPAAAEFQRLARALEYLDPACRDDARFIADAEDLSSDDTTAMAATCARCPLLELCEAYATRARPVGGYWAGHRYGRSTRKDTPNG